MEFAVIGVNDRGSNSSSIAKPLWALKARAGVGVTLLNASAVHKEGGTSPKDSTSSWPKEDTIFKTLSKLQGSMEWAIGREKLMFNKCVPGWPD